MIPLNYFKMIFFNKKISEKKLFKNGYWKLGKGYLEEQNMYLYCVLDIIKMQEDVKNEA